MDPSIILLWLGLATWAVPFLAGGLALLWDRRERRAGAAPAPQFSEPTAAAGELSAERG